MLLQRQVKNANFKFSKINLGWGRAGMVIPMVAGVNTGAMLTVRCNLFAMAALPAPSPLVTIPEWPPESRLKPAVPEDRQYRQPPIWPCYLRAVRRAAWLAPEMCHGTPQI